MDYFDQFIIPFGGLKLGIHHYGFEIGDTFFEKYHFSEICQGHVYIGLILEKQERMLILDFDIRGVVSVRCDRCLDFYDQPISGKERLFIKFGKDNHEESDEIVVIPESENRIDTRHYIYEFINLLLPARCVHPDDENGKSLCNPEVIQKMEEHMEHHEHDPRWDILLKIKDKLNEKQ